MLQQQPTVAAPAASPDKFKITPNAAELIASKPLSDVLLYAREYFDYIKSIDESLYIYNECTFNSFAITNVGVEDGRLVSDYKYDISHRLYGSYDDMAVSLKSWQDKYPYDRIQEFVESEMKYQHRF